MLPRGCLEATATATPAAATLSLHDALPIFRGFAFVEMSNDHEGQQAITALNGRELDGRALTINEARPREADRKSTRLNSSHVSISYAVFCLKKKNARRPAASWKASDNGGPGLIL